MSRHLATKKIVDDIINQLSNGTHIVFARKKVDLYPYLKKDLRQSFSRRSIQNQSQSIVRYMRQQKLITVHDHPKGQVKLRITEAGHQRAHKLTLQNISIPKPSKWDRKWRIVFFDVPETARQDRNRFVAKLKDLGFYQLQRSIWVHPYPCHIEIEYLKKSYNLHRHVFLAEVSRIDHHNRLLNKFRSLVPQRRLS